MRWQVKPTLVTLEGEQMDAAEVAELLGIDEDDAYYLGRCAGRLSGDDIAYLNAKYPELMGAWPLLAKAAGFLAKGGKKLFSGIGKAIRKRRERKKKAKQAKSQAAAQKVAIQAAQQRQYQMVQMQEAAKAAQKKKLLMIGLPLAAVALFLVMNQPKQTPSTPQPEKGGKK